MEFKALTTQFQLFYVLSEGLCEISRATINFYFAQTCLLTCHSCNLTTQQLIKKRHYSRALCVISFFYVFDWLPSPLHTAGKRTEKNRLKVDSSAAAVVNYRKY